MSAPDDSPQTPEAPRAVDPKLAVVMASILDADDYTDDVGYRGQVAAGRLEATVPGSGPLVILEDGTMTRAAVLDQGDIAELQGAVWCVMSTRPCGHCGVPIGTLPNGYVVWPCVDCERSGGCPRPVKGSAS